MSDVWLQLDKTQADRRFEFDCQTQNANMKRPSASRRRSRTPD